MSSLPEKISPAIRLGGPSCPHFSSTGVTATALSKGPRDLESVGRQIVRVKKSFGVVEQRLLAVAHRQNLLAESLMKNVKESKPLLQARNLAYKGFGRGKLSHACLPRKEGLPAEVLGALKTLERQQEQDYQEWSNLLGKLSRTEDFIKDLEVEISALKIEEGEKRLREIKEDEKLKEINEKRERKKKIYRERKLALQNQANSERPTEKAVIVEAVEVSPKHSFNWKLPSHRMYCDELRYTRAFQLELQKQVEGHKIRSRQLMTELGPRRQAEGHRIQSREFMNELGLRRQDEEGQSRDL